MGLRLSMSEKVVIINNLATLITAGVPILEAVNVSQKYSKGNSKKVLNEIEKDLKQGRSISQTFAKFPDAFNAVTVNLIKAAEESGNLDASLKNIELNLKKEKEFNSKIMAALTYPALVMGVFLIIILVILMYVVPRVSQVFSKLKVDMPLPTRVIIAISGFFNSNLLLVGVATALLVLVAILIFIYKKEWVVTVVTAIPGISKLAQYIDLARFTHNMDVLLKSGIPITHALELTEKVVNKKEIKKTVVQARAAVSGGESLSNGLRKSKAIPELMILIIEAGERSGTLDESMNNLAEKYEADTESMLKTITTLLEPLLLVLIGGMVGGIMLSIIAPIYQLIGNIGAASGR